MSSIPETRFERGMRTRRAVLGDAHVDRAAAATTAFDAAFQRFIVEGAWGSVWAREGLSPRDRSLITLCLLAAQGHHDEFEMHLRATRNTGANWNDIAEMLLHVAVYTGVPTANKAFALAKRIKSETDTDKAGN